MSGAIHPLYQYAFMAWCLVKHTLPFTFFTVRELWREQRRVAYATNTETASAQQPQLWV